MSEEEKIQSDATNNDKGDKPETVNPIDRAERTLKGLEEANTKAEAVARRIEEAAARILISGKGHGSVPVQEISQEEKTRIATKNYFKGSAIESFLI